MTVARRFIAGSGTTWDLRPEGSARMYTAEELHGWRSRVSAHTDTHRRHVPPTAGIFFRNAI
jgi:hypothetical protein